MPLENKNNTQLVVKTRWWLPALAAIYLSLGFTGCSSQEAGSSSATSNTGQSAESATDQSGQVKTVATQRRDIVRKAQLSVRVSDVGKTEQEVTAYVASIGGFVSGSESTNYDQTRPGVGMTVRVPVGQFDSAISRFEGMGTRQHKTVSAEDVTGQLVDQEARLKTMLAQEESLRQILRSSRKTTDMLEIQKNLMELRLEIESLAAQRKALSGLAALSTIELELTGEARPVPAAKDRDWLKESWTSASNQLAFAVQGLGSLAVFVFVFSPIWLPPVLVLWWLIRKASKPTPPREA